MAVPKHLPADARAIYREITRHLQARGTFDTTDSLIIEQAATMIARKRIADRALDEHGLTYMCPTASGGSMRRALPEVAISSDCAKQAANLLSRLGITPAERAKIAAPKLSDENDAFGDIYA